MTTFFLVLAVVSCCFVAMGVGLAVGKPLAGSCGGSSAKGPDIDCPACGGDPNKCENRAPEEGSPTSASPRS